MVGVGGLAVGAGDGEHLVPLVEEHQVLAERRRAPLEAERAHRHPPAAVDLADDVVGVGGRAGEEHLVELGVAGDLVDRADLDAVLAHRHEQVRDALVLGRLTVRAGQHEAPVGPVGLRRPHLLALDRPAAVDELGPGLDVGEVRAGAGLAVALAPELGAGDDPRQEAGPLRVGAELDEGRAEQRLADVADAAGGPRLRVLLEVHDLLVQREPAATVLLRPGHAGPAVGAEVALPGQPLLEQAVVVAGAAAAAARRRTRCGARPRGRCGPRPGRPRPRPRSAGPWPGTVPPDLTLRQISVEASRWLLGVEQQSCPRCAM